MRTTCQRHQEIPDMAWIKLCQELQGRDNKDVPCMCKYQTKRGQKNCKMGQELYHHHPVEKITQLHKSQKLKR